MFVSNKHLILSLNVHSHELPHDPFRGLSERITPTLIKSIMINIKNIESIIVIMFIIYYKKVIKFIFKERTNNEK